MRLIYLSLALVLLTSLTSPVLAQKLPLDSLRKPSRHYAKSQFAGDIGLVSLGLGRQFLRNRLEADLSLGFLPKKVGGDDIFTLAVKATYLPTKPVAVGRVDWWPITLGGQLGYTFGEEYFASERYLSKYPNSYYRFSTALNTYFFAGGQVNLARIRGGQRWTGYYEVGAPGEYLVSYLTNPRYLSPGKIFNLALGAKFSL
ncbi:hypothetical protein ACD591_05575 [Rufibacter glacialis]|uniref:Outer membrane protein beta-barrel domain-containing protein n=1 Tax=Rufibacter glacialis TaxID=1259555 RepID=A0A5M8QJ94_9BACT|nr:hypothetical protein [Rufibacter glacialis]KAA6434813.1 hypothetical protein FOE74_11630 [Rufibacter glacialis]GGK72641.1 hypothetical protein GCM10011405_21110 [Rufibacter glacialis]